MSEAALTKIQNDCNKLEAEMQMYKNSQPISKACDAIIEHIVSQGEPFCAGRTEANPWQAASSGDGGCCVVS